MTFLPGELVGFKFDGVLKVSRVLVEDLSNYYFEGICQIDESGNINNLSLKTINNI